jgi:hypothetical protein
MIEMSQVFTIHDAKLCENCKEPMKELQANTYICVCCGL